MERLQKVIANRGYTSRRKAEVLIQEGKVRVDGKVVKELGLKVSPNATIEVEGIVIERENLVYYLFNKPAGCISAVSDDKGRKCVVDFFVDVKERIYPVGRLDYDTTGVLLLTNNGEFANLMTHPKHKIYKKYEARVKGIVQQNELKKLEEGVMIDKVKTAKAKTKLRQVDKKFDASVVELTIHEGKYHQVKRMFEAIGHPVKRLKRVQYAFLDAKGLRMGEYRRLKPHEVKQLKHLANYGK